MFERFSVGVLPWTKEGMEFWLSIPFETRKKIVEFEQIRESEEARNISALGEIISAMGLAMMGGSRKKRR